MQKIDSCIKIHEKNTSNGLFSFDKEEESFMNENIGDDYYHWHRIISSCPIQDFVSGFYDDSSQFETEEENKEDFFVQKREEIFLEKGDESEDSNIDKIKNIIPLMDENEFKKMISEKNRQLYNILSSLEREEICKFKTVEDFDSFIKYSMENICRLSYSHLGLMKEETKKMIKALKRRIKNRISAYNSRKRRAEEMKNIKLENEVLKKRVKQLEQKIKIMYMFPEDKNKY